MKRRNRRPNDQFASLFGTDEPLATTDDIREEEDTAAEEAAPKEEEQEREDAPLKEGSFVPVQTEEDGEADVSDSSEDGQEIEEGESETAPEEEPEKAEAEEEGIEQDTAAEEGAEDGQDFAAEDAAEQEYSEGEAQAEEERVIEDTERPAGGKKRKRGKVKEPMPRKKKVIIGVIAAILTVAVLAAVIVPVTLFFTANVTVSSEEDLQQLDWNSLGDKTVYLQKDITVDGDLTIPVSAKINLNKHTLAITGTLTINGSVQIGTVKGDGFNEKGALSVGNLQASVAEGNVELFSPSSIGEGSVTAALFRAARTLTLENTLTVSATNAYVEGGVTGGENAVLAFAGGGRTDVTGDVQVNMQATAGNYLCVDGSAADIAADGQSYVVLSGKAASISGGKGVLALKNFECAYFTGMDRLGIFVLSCTGNERMEDVGDIFFIERLQTPPAAQVEMRGDRLVLTITEVEHSSAADFSYYVQVNDIPFENITGSEVDITSAVTAAGVYDISIIAKGDFAVGEDGRYNIYAMDKDVYYIDSYPCGLIYEHTFTLDTPSGISVSRASDGSGIVLTFPSVPFADGYRVYVGDGEPIVAEAAADATRAEITISDDLLSPGSNSIYVQAYSNNEQILDSARALTSYVKYEKLATPEVGTPVISGNEVAVAWTKTENSPAKIFKVQFEYTTASGAAVKTVYTTANTITVTLDDITESSSVKVKVTAMGYSYYTDGDAGEANGVR